MTHFGLNQETLDKISSIFSKHPQIQSVLIYGSRAKGTHREGSDIDLSLVGKGLIPEFLRKLELEIDDLLLPYSVDLSIFSQIDHPDLIDHINRVGQVFYQREKPNPKLPTG